MKSPFATRFTERNAKAWAFRMHLEINQARENILNLIRDDLGISEISAADLRLRLDNIDDELDADDYARARTMMNFADNLWAAEFAFFEGGRILK